MAKTEGGDRRTQAAAARAQAESAQKRESRIKILGGLAVLVVVVGIVFAGYFGAQASKPHADAAAKQPVGTLQDAYGWAANGTDSSKSTLVVYEDPQCPICAQFEATFGTTILSFIKDKSVNVVYQMATFIDDNLPQSNHASRRAVAALGCAIDQGYGLEYHQLIYANQPSTEGAGYSDALLRKLGEAAGITGTKLTAFQKCFDAGTYLGWADNLGQKFRDNGIQGTPTLVLDGTQVPDAALASVKTFSDYIAQHKK